MSFILGLTRVVPIARQLSVARNQQLLRFCTNTKIKSASNRKPLPPQKDVSSPTRTNVGPYESEQNANYHFGDLIASGKIDEAMSRMDDCFANGRKVTVVTVSKLIQDMKVSNKRFDEIVVKYFDLLLKQGTKPDAVLLNNIIRGYAKIGLYDKATAWFHKMKQLGVRRNFRHYMIFFTSSRIPWITHSQIVALIDSAYEDQCLDVPLMGAAIHLRNVSSHQIDVILAKITTYKIPMETKLLNIILSLFDKRREYTRCLEYFEQYKTKCELDSISYTIASDAALNVDPAVTHKIIDEAKSKNLMDAHLYGIKLRAYYTQRNWKDMSALYEEAVRKGLKLDNIVFTYAIKMYGIMGKVLERNFVEISKGDIEGLQRVFSQIEKSEIKLDHIAYAALLKSISKNGSPREVLECFNHLENKSDNVVINSQHCYWVLKSLEQALEIPAMRAFIENMSTKHNVKPSAEHWNCLLKALVIKGESSKFTKLLHKLEPKLKDSAVTNALIIIDHLFNNRELAAEEHLEQWFMNKQLPLPLDFTQALKSILEYCELKRGHRMALNIWKLIQKKASSITITFEDCIDFAISFARNDLYSAITFLIQEMSLRYSKTPLPTAFYVQIGQIYLEQHPESEFKTMVQEAIDNAKTPAGMTRQNIRDVIHAIHEQAK